MFGEPRAIELQVAGLQMFPKQTFIVNIMLSGAQKYNPYNMHKVGPCNGYKWFS